MAMNNQLKVKDAFAVVTPPKGRHAPGVRPTWVATAKASFCYLKGSE